MHNMIRAVLASSLVLAVGAASIADIPADDIQPDSRDDIEVDIPVSDDTHDILASVEPASRDATGDGATPDEVSTSNVGDAPDEKMSAAENFEDLVTKLGKLKELLGKTQDHSPEMVQQMDLLNNELKKLGLDLAEGNDLSDSAEELASKCFTMAYKHLKRHVSTKAHTIVFSTTELNEGMQIPPDLADNPVFRASATCFLDITTEEVKRFDKKLVNGMPARLLEVMETPGMKQKVLAMDIEHARLLQDLATERRYEYEELEEQQRLNPNSGVSGIFLAIALATFVSGSLLLAKKFYTVLQEPKSKAKVKKQR